MRNPRHAPGVLALIVAFAFSAAAQTREAGEYELKAAMIANVVRLVDWPAAKAASLSLRVCIANSQELEDALTRTFAKSPLAGTRRLAVVRAPSPLDPEQCDALFFGGTDRKRIEAVMRATGGMPVLTLGENDRFTAQGGMIALRIQDDHLQVEVNLQATQAAGLAISSRLLRIAVVRSGGTSGGRPGDTAGGNK